jgi:hypothetical protein
MVRPGPFDKRLTKRENDESPGFPGLFFFYRDYQAFLYHPVAATCVAGPRN